MEKSQQPSTSSAKSVEESEEDHFSESSSSSDNESTIPAKQLKYDLEETPVLLLCKPAPYQIEAFNEIYLEIKRSHKNEWNARAFHVQLTEICNYPLQISGKGKVLKSILEKTIQLDDSTATLIVGKNDQCLKNYLKSCEHYENVWTTFLNRPEDVCYLNFDGSDKAILAVNQENLDFLHYGFYDEFKIDRTIFYDAFTLTHIKEYHYRYFGQIYQLVTAGSVEELRFLANYGVPGANAKLLSLPEDYGDSMSVKMLSNNPECPILKHWKPYPVASITKAVQKILNLTDLHNIEFMLTKKLSNSYSPYY